MITVPQTLLQQADELFGEIRLELWSKVYEKFSSSKSFTPGLLKSMEKEQEPLLRKILLFRMALKKACDEVI